MIRLVALSELQFLVYLVMISCIFMSRPAATCPPGCTCTTVKRGGRGGNDHEATTARGRRVECSKNPAPFTTVSQISLQLKLDTIQLDLSNNDLTIIRNGAFMRLSMLQKLTLRGNQISILEPGAFQGLENLVKLDLSNNNIGFLNSSMFTGMRKLERLSLSSNRINTIPEGTFNDLPSLKKIDFRSQYLRCDCQLTWIATWSKSRKIRITASTTCAIPKELKGVSLKSLSSEDLHCERPLELPEFEIKPSASQVVFEGDKLPFECRAAVIDPQTKMVWIREGDIVETNRTDGVFVHTIYTPDGSQMIHSLVLENLEKRDMGVWECMVSTPRGNVSSRVNIIVVTKDARHCPDLVKKSDKGVYNWSRTLADMYAVQDCKVGSNKAKFYCNAEGQWVDLDVKDCDFVSEDTRKLQTFAEKQVNTSEIELYAKDFRVQFLSDKMMLNSAQHIVFASTVIENLQSQITEFPSVADVILDTADQVMSLNPIESIQAQKQVGACSRLVKAVEKVPAALLGTAKDISRKTNNISLVAQSVTTKTFLGITCWVLKSDLICLQLNQTQFLENIDKKLKAAVFVPPSILKKLENITGESPRFFNYSAIIYHNSNLFPFTSLEHSDPVLNNRKWKIVSSVLSFSVGEAIENLTDPVTLVFQVKNTSQRLKVGYWDFGDKNGYGDWRTDGCKVVSITGNFCTAHCYHLTNFAILQDLSPFKEIHTIIMEPVTYIGSCVCLLCLMAVLLTYISCFRFLNVPKKMKHSVINICITVCLLIITFTMGINRTDHQLPCCIVGMLIHYLTLCAIFWITITSKNMLKKFVKAEKPPAPPPEPIMMPLPPKPMIRFYLLGWGVPLIVCGITAAVNLNHYSKEEYCFLEWEPSIGAFFGPVALLVGLNLILFMRISCVVRGATKSLVDAESEEIHTNEIELAPKNNARTRCIDTRSVNSDDSDTSSNSSIMDLEKRPITQLRALVALLFLYILMWLCAAMAVAKPLREVIPMQGVIFSYFYGAFSIFFGGFMIGYYCLSRKDSRDSWKRFFTCQKIPNGASQMTHLNGHVVHSDSNNEVETISSKNYNITKAVQLKNLPQKDTNLVTAQNNSSITEGSVCSSHDQMPSFYNPRQNGVAKKFWEKKHHSKIFNNKDFCKDFGGSGNDSNTDISSVSRLQKHLSQSSTGDNNTHFNVQIQIQSNNVKSQNTTVNHNLPSYDHLFPTSNAGSSLYSGTALIDRNLIPPPVGGSQTPTEVTASPSCSIVSSQPSSQLPHHNHCRSPSSSSLGTKSYPSAFMPIQPRNNTLPRQTKEINTGNIEQVQTNGVLPRPRDFDGQSQTSDQNNHVRRSSPARGRFKSPSPSKLSHRHGNNLYNHGHNLYRSRTPNDSKTFSANEMSDCSVSKDYFRGRAPSVGYSSDGSRHPRSLKSFKRDVDHKIPEGDASVLSDNPSVNGSNKRILPDSDSQIHRNRNKVKHDSDGHISEPIHRRHHHHHSHHRSHGSHRHSRGKMSKQRSLNWEDSYKERPPKVPYTYVNHTYAEKVFENLLKLAQQDNISPKSKVFWLPRSTSSFEKVFHGELKPMIENVDSTTTEDDDEDLSDVWVLKQPPEDVKKETSV